MLRRTKRPSAGDPGHIVPYTKGTSNEISFSVLHSMRNAAAEEGSPQPPAWEFPQEEVRQRRRQRRRANRLMVAGIALAVVALVAALATVLVVNIQNQLDHVARMNGVLREVVAQCDQLNPYDAAVDAALVQQVGAAQPADIKKAYDAASPSLPATIEHLQELRSQLEELQQYLQVPTDREMANQGISAINAQLNLIDLGQQAMAYALPAQEAYAKARGAMEGMVAAAEADEEATQLMSTLNMENAKASQAKSQEALTDLTAALDDLKSARSEVEELAPRASGEAEAALESIDIYMGYAQTRLDAQQAAISSMQAYLDRDKGALQKANDHYNQLAQQAVDQIADQPTTPPDAFAVLFTSVRADDADQWAAERARLDVALTAVRDHLS